MNDYVVLDIETTGFNPETCDIIEIGAWKVANGVAIAKFISLVKPSRYIPSSIQELTGISMEEVKDAEPINCVLPEFIDFCGDLPFLGHNLSFDYNFLKTKSDMLGLDISCNGLRTGIDTLNLAKKFLYCKSNKLIDVAEHFSIKLESKDSHFHRADYDSYITKLIYDRFQLQFPEVRGIQIPSLLIKQDVKYGKVVNNDTLSFD